jgi:hypothetical protein
MALDNVILFSDQLQIPLQQKLLVNVQAEHRSVDLDGILELERERFGASPEYRRFIQMRREKGEE